MSRKEQEIMRDIKRRWAQKCELGELVCFLCGQPIKSMKDCNADHWVPRALGGKTEESNLKPAHKPCNSAKGCLSPEEFLAHKDEILAKVYKKEEKRKKTQKSHNSLNKKSTNNQVKNPQKSKKCKNNISHTASYELKQTYNIGTTAYYIKEDLTEKKPKFEIKEGVIIGFIYRDVVEYALVKNFYINTNGKMDSELLEVIPMTKNQAKATKIEYEKLTKHLLLQILNKQKTLEH